jgi:hypothetical protein
MRDRSDPHAREQASLVARQYPPSGVSPDEAIAAVKPCSARPAIPARSARRSLPSKGRSLLRCARRPSRRSDGDRLFHDHRLAAVLDDNRGVVPVERLIAELGLPLARIKGEGAFRARDDASDRVVMQT